jgi:peptidoglycan glycosyltransferase
MGRATSPEVAAALTQMMTSVVDRGTGRKARIQGVQVAGKTGTAQNSATDHAWFVGFAPADHPKIAVAVFVKNGGATGGDISAPVARQVIQAYLSGHGG